LDLDKSWHGLHFLLSGTKDGGTEPQHFLLGEQTLPDTGEAEVFHYRAAQVRETDRILQASTPETLRKRFDGRQMRELDIYPAGEWDQAMLDYLLANFDDLRVFVAQQAAAGNELLVVLC
jgi:hypothetical protein